VTGISFDPRDSVAARLRKWARTAWAYLQEPFRADQMLEIASIMTLLLSVVHLAATAQLREFVYLLGVAGIIDRRLLRSAAFWFGLTGLMVANHLQLWHTLDNHKYLLTYWCLALGIARLSRQPERTAVVNARLLIGLCFLFATLSKLLSAEYMNGSFFEFTLLTDGRFSGFSDLVGGVPNDTMSANSAAIRDLQRPYGNTEFVHLQGAPRIDLLAQVMTWWTIAVEGSIAVAFLLPTSSRVAAWRDLTLLLFMFSTYPVATVVGFGRILSAMGLVQTPNRFGFERTAYGLAFVLLPIYKFPFARAVRWLINLMA
jgi:hypothetical protein